MWSKGLIVFASMIKSSLKCTCVDAADIISRRHIQDKTIFAGIIAFDHINLFLAHLSRNIFLAAKTKLLISVGKQ